MRLAMLALAALLVASACGGGQKPMSRDEEPLADRDPYAFHRAIGKTLLRTDQPRRALPHLRRLERMRPASPEPYYLVARAYMAMQLHEPAGSYLEQSLAADDTYAPAHAMRGVLLDAEGHHARAGASHERAIELAPRHPGYHNNMGFNLYLRGHYEGAIEAYNRAIGLEPSSRRIHNNLAFAYGERGEIDKAWDHFRRGGSLAEATNNLGMVHEGRGELDAAFELYLEALRTDPDLVQARGNLQRVSASLDRPLPNEAKREMSRRAPRPGSAPHELTPRETPARDAEERGKGRGKGRDG
jgi:Flp pilus assembly protein TadD